MGYRVLVLLSRLLRRRHLLPYGSGRWSDPKAWAEGRVPGVRSHVFVTAPTGTLRVSASDVPVARRMWIGTSRDWLSRRLVG